MTGRETLHARPSAAFDGTNMYGTFCRDRERDSSDKDGIAPSPRTAVGDAAKSLSVLCQQSE